MALERMVMILYSHVPPLMRFVELLLPLQEEEEEEEEEEIQNEKLLEVTGSG